MIYNLSINLYITTTNNNNKMKNYPYKTKCYYENENNIALILAIILQVFVIMNLINS